MECNKEEARRAMDIAERKLSENDYNGANKFANKAHDLYPQLDGLKQVLTMIDVYISASNKNNGGVESDWYGILGVDPLADDETLKKQYKKLARLFHPDKNKFNGAFILVSDAWCLLSDHSKRIAYDQKLKSKEDEQKMRDASYSTSASDSAKDARERFAAASARVYANEAERKPTGTGNANSTSEAERLFKNPMTRVNANSTSEAERLFKKPVMATGNANYSTSQAERLLQNPMERANANSTSEAERLFKKPMRYVI